MYLCNYLQKKGHRQVFLHGGSSNVVTRSSCNSKKTLVSSNSKPEDDEVRSDHDSLEELLYNSELHMFYRDVSLI